MTRSFFYISGFAFICQNLLIDILIADSTEIRHIHRYIQPQVYIIFLMAERRRKFFKGWRKPGYGM